MTVDIFMCFQAFSQVLRIFGGEDVSEASLPINSQKFHVFCWSVFALEKFFRV